MSATATTELSVTPPTGRVIAHLVSLDLLVRQFAQRGRLGKTVRGIVSVHVVLIAIPEAGLVIAQLAQLVLSVSMSVRLGSLANTAKTCVSACMETLVIQSLASATVDVRVSLEPRVPICVQGCETESYPTKSLKKGVV